MLHTDNAKDAIASKNHMEDLIQIWPMMFFWKKHSYVHGPAFELSKNKIHSDSELNSFITRTRPIVNSIHFRLKTKNFKRHAQLKNQKQENHLMLPPSFTKLLHVILHFTLANTLII